MKGEAHRRMARGGQLAMDSVWFHPGPPCLTLLRPADRPPLKLPYSYSRFRGGSPAAVFYHSGHPTPYAYGEADEAEPRAGLEKE
jgi:hypothetical protein